MRLEEIEKLCAEATSGPWERCLHLRDKTVDETCGCGYRGGIWGGDCEFMVCEIGSTVISGQEGLEPPRYNRAQELKNAEFIAKSRELMPKLIAVAKAASKVAGKQSNAQDHHMLERALKELERDE